MFVIFTLGCGSKNGGGSAPSTADSCGFMLNEQGQQLRLAGAVQVSEEENFPDAYSETVQKAMDVWNKALGHTVFSLGKKISRDLALADGQNSLLWQTQWPQEKEDQEAYTTLTIVGDVIEGAHIELNAKKYTFSVADEALQGTLDLESILIHELGHALGLEHDSSENSVMAARLSEGTLRRELFPADLSHLQCHQAAVQ